MDLVLAVVLLLQRDGKINSYCRRMFFSQVIAFNNESYYSQSNSFKKTVSKIKVMKPQIVFTLSGMMILISLGGCASGDPVYIEPVG